MKRAGELEAMESAKGSHGRTDLPEWESRQIGQRGLAVKIVDELAEVCKCPGKRPVHTLGIGATGFFEASPVAQAFCAAKHFQGTKIPVTVRFSNGAGSAVRHDEWSDVRGMAVRFHLDGDRDGDSATDLIAMTLPTFFTPTPEAFLDFAIAAKPAPCVRESPWRKIIDYLRMTPPMRDPYPGQTVRPEEGGMRFADQNRSAQLAVLQAASIGAPASYVRADYHAVHTFIVKAPEPDGTRRWVRFTWQPVDGVLPKRPPDPPVDDYLPDDDYLNETLRARLATGPARFSLMMMIGEAGDDFDDPSRPWPPHRVRVMMGTLTLRAVPDEADQKDRIDRMSFNPLLLTDGIEPSGDPVLAIRRDAYEYSSERRGGIACPFAGG